MQPILAESAPRARSLLAVGFAAGLTAALAVFAMRAVIVLVPHHGSGIPHTGRCAELHRLTASEPTVIIEPPVPAYDQNRIRVIDHTSNHLISIQPRPPTLVGDLQITY